MTDKYITSSQYREGLNSIKEYIDKSIPHIRYLSIFTLSADKVLEIYNSTSKAMEFDKPSNIDSNNEIIMTYNNKDIIGSIIRNSPVNYTVNFNNNDIDIGFYIGYDINQKNNENKMVINIDRLNTNITSDLVLKQKEDKYLNNKYLKKDVAIQNSITIGTRLISDIGQYSFSNGKETTASGDNSHAEGEKTQATNINCHAEGTFSTASGEASHAEGNWSTASGFSSHVEGSETTASGSYSHAEGNNTKASGESSHAEGNRTVASGVYSHAEGMDTDALGAGSHAEGWGTTASGDYSHTEGYFTKASSEAQHVQGKCNIEDTKNKYAHIVGNGTDVDNRSNAHTLDWNGNAWYAGKLSQEGTPTEDKDLSTKKYVDDNTPIKSLPVNPTTRTGAIVDVNNITVSGCYALPKRLDGTHWTNLMIRAMINDGSNKGKTVMLSGYQNHVFYVNIESKKIYCDNLRIVYNIGTTDDTTYIRTEPYYLPTTNTKEFTPTSDYNPATKKYVDDAKASIVVPTKTSELTNDSNFLTKHQPLTNYATIEYVDSKLTTNYVSKEELTESTKPADTTTVKTTLNDILGGDYIE